MRPHLQSAPIFLQILALVLVSLVAAQLINLAVVLTVRDPPRPGFSIAMAARALRTGHAKDGDAALRVSVQDAPPAFATGARSEGLDPLLGRLLARELAVAPERVRVRLVETDVKVRHAVRSVVIRRTDTNAGTHRIVLSMRGSDDPPGVGALDPLADTVVFPPFTAALQRPDGRWTVVSPARPLLSPWQTRMLIWFGLSAIVLTPAAYLVARRLARPVDAFAQAAERLGRDPNAPPLASTGPAEVRVAVAAFNDMQERLRRYVADRTAMVAAIAHDLRTPLTRMRFRLESAAPELRERMAADIEQMDAMIGSALAFVRGETQPGARVKLDLAALAASVVDDMAEMGADAVWRGAEHAVIEGDPVALKRMTANLVENAVKFGGCARVELASVPDAFEITVDDDGPGLPEAELERVFEPFHRAEPSRNADTGGFGLGLAVARSIARAHGSDVTLQNRAGGGLRATVQLPRPA